MNEKFPWKYDSSKCFFTVSLEAIAITSELIFLPVSLNYLEIKAPEICFASQPSGAMLCFYIKKYYIHEGLKLTWSLFAKIFLLDALVL